MDSHGERSAGSVMHSKPAAPRGARSVIASVAVVLIVLAAIGGFLAGRGSAATSTSTTPPRSGGVASFGARDLAVQGAPDDANDYAIYDPSCTVNLSDTMVIATGTFAGTRDAPLPTLPSDRTYNVIIGIFDSHGNVLGTSASNERTDYMNNGGQWSVQVKLFSGFAPSECMYSIGTYGVGDPSAPPLPQVPPALN
jgi:hypothetical protein